MALATIHFRSQSLNKNDTMMVAIPEREGPWPVLYLLHGLTMDHTCYSRYFGIERYLLGRDVMVVMPDTHRFFYVNDPRPGGLAYEDYVVNDVMGFVERTFPTIDDCGARGVAGISMGGYGAMMLALRHPERFCVAASISGAVHFGHELLPPRLGNVATLAEALQGSEYDLWQLAEAYAQGGHAPAMRLSCGLDDHLIDVNRAFHAHLMNLGIEHEYVEHPGAHDWGTWVPQVPEALRFALDHLRQPESSA
jgi:S-formylglutathione hydrolase FrmB